MHTYRHAYVRAYTRTYTHSAPVNLPERSPRRGPHPRELPAADWLCIGSRRPHPSREAERDLGEDLLDPQANLNAPLPAVAAGGAPAVNTPRRCDGGKGGTAVGALVMAVLVVMVGMMMTVIIIDFK